YFFFSSRRRHTRWPRDWSSDVCSSDLISYVNNTVDPNNDFPATLGTSGSTVIDLGGGVRNVNVVANFNSFDLQIPAVIQNGGLKIGRASCRERGEVPERAICLKKKS